MRGKATRQRPGVRRRRITPAYAGKRRTTRTSGARYRDHPRVCGEKCQPGPRSPGWAGSPPRMRGKGGGKIALKNPSGITPAYAGKRDFCQSCAYQDRDHPRVCGEKGGQAYYRAPARGSPPRMRGKVSSRTSDTRRPGITPAYAGKSGKSPMTDCKRRDHPRVCGEKLIASKRETLCTGSPPRMRGKVTR